MIGSALRETAHLPDLCPHCGAPSAPRLLVAHIQAVVAAYYGIQAHYMKSDQRGADIALPRQIAMLLSSELTPKSLPDLGRCFNRDHTTVMYAIRTVRRKMLSDAELEFDVEVLRQRLKPEEQAESIAA